YGHAGVGGFGGGDGNLAGGGGAGFGGGIFSNQGDITLINNTFSGNSATAGTAGLDITPNILGIPPMKGGEDGQAYGGAVFLRNGSLVAVYNTFNGNVAKNGGTGVYILGDTTDGGNNTSPSAGFAVASLINNILVGKSQATDLPSQAPSTVADFLWGTNGPDATRPLLENSHNNLVGLNPDYLSGGLVSTAVVSSANPLLGPLSFNGGDTKTMAVAPGSPADGAGEGNVQLGGFALDINKDQRGNGRPTYSTLGAYQVAPRVSFEPGALNLGPVVSGTASPPVYFSLTGANLLSSVTLTAPPAVEISADGGYTWNTTYNVSPYNGVLSGTILQARLSTDGVLGTLNDVIRANSPGMAEQDLPVTATVRVGVYVSSAQASIPVTGSNVFTFTRQGGNLASALTTSLLLDISTTVPAGYTLTGGGAVVKDNTISVTFPAFASSVDVRFTPAPNPTGIAQSEHWFSILSDSGMTYTAVQANGLLVNNSRDDGTDGTLRRAWYNALTMSGPITIPFAPALAGQTFAMLGTDYHGANAYGSVSLAATGNANITIDGSSVPGLVLDAQGQQRLFAVTQGSSLTLKNLTLRGGLAQGLAGYSGLSGGGSGGGGAGLGGAVLNDGGSFTAVGCTFTNNSALGGQGGSPNSSGTF
ncbi:MAG: choice-of-anchor Q domain-containing protein, partial [Gemmataceae bacterium]